MENKWWEFYFIRYFVGSVFGALIFTAIIFHPDSGLSSTIGELLNVKSLSLSTLTNGFLWVALIVGVSFCYISSAPILLLHTYRCKFNFTSNKVSRGFWIYILIIMSVYAFLYYMYSDDWNLVQAMFMAPLVFVLATQAAMSLSVYRTSTPVIFDFYKDLVKNRGKDCERRRQYTESYKHLREHGNAFLILFCESVLGMALFSASTLNQVILVLFLWLVPVLPVWFVGTYLESKLQDI
ncbi:hypothetical protein [Photobacterium halotolerans]|uniref:hypothetical protein n=1 Tax=Photobacterium halotolerans TaxID=265726 RepID=UPI0004860A62|nr:hypothetical protein [Photobacterium halotolerans]